MKKAKGYDIYRCDGRSKTYQKVQTLEGSGVTRWMDTNLKSGTRYKYKVLPYTLAANQIATVDRHGKVKFLKKGKCAIWAKAHNGVNSKRVTIIVKK